MDIFKKSYFVQGVAHLLMYQTVNGNMDVDETYLTSDRFPLGEFVGDVRKAESDGILQPWQKERLQSIDFSLEKANQAWESMYSITKEYIVNNGGILPEVTERTSDDVLVGAWVRQQQMTFRHLSKQKQRMLRDIGIRPYIIETDSSDTIAYTENIVQAYQKTEKHRFGGENP